MNVSICKYMCIEESTQYDANSFALLEWNSKGVRFVQKRVAAVETEGKQMTLFSY